MSGRRVGKRKFSWKYRKTTEIISIAFFDRHCCLSSKNSLTNLFSQYKISLCWRNTNDGSSFIALAKSVVASQHKRRRKIFFKFLTPTRTWKCTRSIMQISYLYASAFPSKIKTSANLTNRAEKQVERITNNRKQKLVMIKHCSEKLTS